MLACWTRIFVIHNQPPVLFLISLSGSILSSLGISLLILLEHQRISESSTAATLYLLGSSICDIIYLTMPLQAARQAHSTAPLVSRCLMYTLLLMLESRPKSSVINADNEFQSPEERHGILSRIIFAWIHPFLLKGYRNMFVDKDLPFLSRDIKPELTTDAMLSAWSQRG